MILISSFLLPGLSYVLYAYNIVSIQLVLLVDMGSSSFSVFNDGSTRDLMSLTGTVPVSYRGKECFYIEILHIVPS